ncbi:hypothetical protein [Hymenobacter sp.]|jgi:hypothetical protein|uniref:hypothetical protein n=1 Tax=Hymenobacter sp. TaxID=1898978 RepID=UPI002ED98115
MSKFIFDNALKSTFGNVVVNTVIPFLLLLSAPFVNLEGPTPNLVSVLVPGVFMSALVTTIITFGVMTAQRKAGTLAPALPADTRWFPKALVTGIGIGLLFALPVLVIILVLQGTRENVELPKLTVIAASTVVGGLTGLLSSIVASKRAAKLSGVVASI